MTLDVIEEGAEAGRVSGVLAADTEGDDAADGIAIGMLLGGWLIPLKTTPNEGLLQNGHSDSDEGVFTCRKHSTL